MSDKESIRAYILALPMTEESMPFDDTILVYKVMGRMFAYLRIDSPEGYLALKCEPELAVHLRELYEAVEPAWHMNKRHWNGVHLGQGVPMAELQTWAKASYDLVCDALPRQSKAQLCLAQSTQEDRHSDNCI